MPVVERSALVDYSPQQMFDLVNDIEAYPAFMTGCIAANILSATAEVVEARLTLGLSGIQQSFVTRNYLNPPQQMTMHLVEGPFRHFEGAWTFQPLNEAHSACKVGLRLDFAFKNPIVAITASRGMEQTASRQVDALCQRADKIYA